ncbi:MAG: hypothetical protein R3F19_14155 [Verrucomicrobiales bacterium]
MGLRASTALFEHRANGSGTKRTAEDVAKEFAETLTGQQLVSVKVDYQCLDAFAILHRSGDFLGERRFNLLTAARTNAGLGTVLGDFNGNLFGRSKT